MFTETFLDNYKLTVEFIRNTFRAKILKAFKELDVPEDQQEMMMSISLATPKIVETMNAYPAIILAMFDKEGVFYFTTINPLYNDNKKFCYTKLVGATIVESDHGYSSRLDAEYAALMAALYEMEEILSSKEQLK